jgi:hypothetical protein
MRLYIFSLFLILNLVIIISVVGIEYRIDRLSDQMFSEDWLLFDLGD